MGETRTQKEFLGPAEEGVWQKYCVLQKGGKGGQGGRGGHGTMMKKGWFSTSVGLLIFGLLLTFGCYERGSEPDGPGPGEGVRTVTPKHRVACRIQTDRTEQKLGETVIVTVKVSGAKLVWYARDKKGEWDLHRYVDVTNKGAIDECFSWYINETGPWLLFGQSWMDPETHSPFAFSFVSLGPTNDMEFDWLVPLSPKLFKVGLNKISVRAPSGNIIRAGDGEVYALKEPVVSNVLTIEVLPNE